MLALSSSLTTAWERFLLIELVRMAAAGRRRAAVAEFQRSLTALTRRSTAERCNLHSHAERLGKNSDLPFVVSTLVLKNQRAKALTTNWIGNTFPASERGNEERCR